MSRLKMMVVWFAAAAACGGSAAQSPGAPEGALKSEVALKYEEPTFLSGDIYPQGPKPGKLLFKFKRVAERSGSRLNVVREYNYPDGKPAARERVIYEGNKLISFELEELQIGTSGSARIQYAADSSAKGTIQFEYRKQGEAKARHRAEPWSEATLIADMIAPFLIEHWDALMRGGKVRCRYLVVPRMETVGFTFSKASESSWQGQAVVILKMEASSSIVGLLVDPLYFTVQKAAPHRVLQYSGRTTPKIELGGKWKDLDAVTVFNWQTAR